MKMGLTRQTALLEASDWCEDSANTVLERATQVVSDIKANNNIKNFKEFEQQFIADMLIYAQESQIIIILDHIKDGWENNMMSKRCFLAIIISILPNNKNR